MVRVLGGAATAVMWVVLCAPAWAAGGQGEKIGRNLGHLMGSWAKSLFIGIAALVALAFLLSRRFSELALFVLAAIVVGGFVVAPDAIIGTIQDIWKTLTA